jgi:hypothetical protein
MAGEWIAGDLHNLTDHELPPYNKPSRQHATRKVTSRAQLSRSKPRANEHPGDAFAKTCIFHPAIKGKMTARKSSGTKGKQMTLKPTTSKEVIDPIALVLRIKNLASDLGGLKNLKALVDVLSE